MERPEELIECGNGWSLVKDKETGNISIHGFQFGPYAKYEIKVPLNGALDYSEPIPENYGKNFFGHPFNYTTKRIAANWETIKRMTFGSRRLSIHHQILTPHDYLQEEIHRGCLCLKIPEVEEEKIRNAFGKAFKFAICRAIINAVYDMNKYGVMEEYEKQKFAKAK